MNDNNRDQRFLRTYERTTTLNTTTTKTPVYYRSSIGSRSTIIQPARNWSLPNRYAGFPTLPVGLRQISQANAKLANPVNSNRERERRDLVDLNNRFAQYIEKIRLLEAQNKKLDHEINALRSRSSNTSSHIKDMYDIEIREAEKLLNSIKQETDAVQQRRKQNEYDRDNLQRLKNDTERLQKADRDAIDALQRQIGENEANIAILRRRIADIDDELGLYKQENQRLSNEISRLQNEIYAESFQKSNAEIEKAEAQNQLTGLQQAHEADLADIRARNISTDTDQSLLFRNQLATAIQQHREEYERSLEDYRQELETQYSLIVQQQTPYLMPAPARPQHDDSASVQRANEELTKIIDENRHLTIEKDSLKSKLGDLQKQRRSSQDPSLDNLENHHRRMNELSHKYDLLRQQYEELTGIKSGLQKEIDEYRKLLEDKNGLRSITDRIWNPASGTTSNYRAVRTNIYRSSGSRDDSDTESKFNSELGSAQFPSTPRADTSYYSQRPSSQNRGSVVQENPSHYSVRESFDNQHEQREVYQSRRTITKTQSSVDRNSVIRQESSNEQYTNGTQSFNYQSVNV